MPGAHTCPRCGGPATPIIGQYVSCAACDAAAIVGTHREPLLDELKRQIALGAHLERRQRADGGDDLVYVAASGARIPLTSGPMFVVSPPSITLLVLPVSRDQPGAARATDLELEIAGTLQAEEISLHEQITAGEWPSTCVDSFGAAVTAPEVGDVLPVPLVVSPSIYASLVPPKLTDAECESLLAWRRGKAKR
jgi:hypothetical protein